MEKLWERITYSSVDMQTFNHIPLDQMALQDLIQILKVDECVPDSLRINDQYGPFIASIQASRRIDSYPIRPTETQRLNLGLHMVTHHLHTMLSTTGTPIIPLIDTEKEVVTIKGHVFPSARQAQQGDLTLSIRILDSGIPVRQPMDSWFIQKNISEDT